MIYSMTAFARAETEQDGLQLAWELRSVNHRYLETQFRMPEVLRGQEHVLRETLRKHLKRGKIDCTLRADRAGAQPAMELNRSLLLQILAVLEQVKRDVPNMAPANAMDVLRWPGILGDATQLEDEGVKARVNELFEEALSELIAHRGREGAQLRDAVSQRLDEIDLIVTEVQALMVDAPRHAKAKLEQRVAELSVTLNPERLEQEVVAFS